MVNRMEPEKQPFVGEWLLRTDVHAVTGGNRCEHESLLSGDGQEGAHNGVRGDDVVGVREGEASEQITNSDEGGRHHVSTQSHRYRIVRIVVADRRQHSIRPRARACSGRDADRAGAAGYLREESGCAVHLEDLGL